MIATNKKYIINLKSINGGRSAKHLTGINAFLIYKSSIGAANAT